MIPSGRIFFFHSFTSDSDLSNSLVKDYHDGSPITGNWLPYDNNYMTTYENCVRQYSPGSQIEIIMFEQTSFDE